MMRPFLIFLRASVPLAVSILSGVWSAHLVLARAVAQGKPEYEVRLAAYMTGLFVAGVLGTLMGIGMLLMSKKRGSA